MAEKRTIIVADTSAFLAVVMNEPERSPILNATSGCGIVSPSVLPFEIGNALSAMLKRGRIEHSEIGPIWSAFKTIAVELRPVDVLASLHIAAEYGIYAYDGYVLECAASLDRPLLTLDGRMTQIARKMGLHLVELEL